jgi:membrane associated rhomboid family serine protease
MYFDLFLLSVLIVTAYLGPMVVLRNPPGYRLFGWLLIGDGACALLSLLGRHTGAVPAAGSDMLGVVAIGAAVCLLMVPPVLRDLARRAVRAERMHLARRLVALRQHLQPGLDTEYERELLDTLIAVRSGRVDEAVDAMREARKGLREAADVRRVDEHIALTYLSARRWQDAIDVYESVEERDLFSPQLLVEMVRAYCEVGAIQSATVLVAYIESFANLGDPMLVLLIHRARMVFLAFAGQVAAVDALVARDGPMGVMPPASRIFWAGVARFHGGDREGARRHLQRAVALTRRDAMARAFAETLLRAVDDPETPRPVPPDVAEFAARLADEVATMESGPAQVMPPMSNVPVRRVPATLALALANLAVFAIVLLVYGSTGDHGGLVRAGANVKSAVVAGEWWRLASSMFLHVGFVHLLINVWVLWILGKLIEQIYGPLRMFVVYMVAGLIGATASTFIGSPGISAGASGAVLGLLGALIAELGLHRRAYPERWRKLIFGYLVFVALAQVAIGFFYPAIDQSAHLGGLLGGAVVAALISPRGSPRGSRSASMSIRGLVAVLALAGAAMLVYGVVGVATTGYGDTLERYGSAPYRVGNSLVFMGPAHLQVVSEGRYRDGEVIELAIEARPRAGRSLAEFLEHRLRDERPGARARERSSVERLSVPEPWRSRELLYREDGMGGEQAYRIVVFGREHGNEVWLGSLLVPEVLASDIEPTLSRILGSMRPL